MNAGDTFTVFDGKTRHLWIALSNPSDDPEHAVIVNFTTHTIDEESHCVVHKGEHPFIKHKTAIRYRDARVVALDQLEKLLNTDLADQHSPLSDELLGQGAVRRV